MTPQIGDHRVVVEQRVVDVDEEDESSGTGTSIGRHPRPAGTARWRSPTGTASRRRSPVRSDDATRTRCRWRAGESRSTACRRSSRRSGCRRSAAAARKTGRGRVAVAWTPRAAPAPGRCRRRGGDRPFRPDGRDRCRPGPTRDDRAPASPSRPARRARRGRAIDLPRDRGRTGRCRRPCGSSRPASRNCRAASRRRRAAPRRRAAAPRRAPRRRSSPASGASSRRSAHESRARRRGTRNARGDHDGRGHTCVENTHNWRIGESENWRISNHQVANPYCWFRQWRFGRACDHGAIGLEPRPVARAVPGALGLVPVDDAAHMRADRRALHRRAALVAIHGELLAVHLDDLARSARHLSQRFAFGAGEPIANEVVRVVLVLLEVVPEPAADLLPARSRTARSRDSSGRGCDRPPSCR